MERKATRLLLIGNDPIFAWALEQKAGILGFHLEHVYTLGEALLRLNRFHYLALLLDGLGKDDMDVLSRELDPHTSIFILEDIDRQDAGIPAPDGLQSVAVFLPKESALSQILSSLQALPR